MSGFEIAGVILAAIPIIYGILESYQKGLPLAGSNRWYHTRLATIIGDFTTEEEIFRSDLSLFLDKVVRDEAIVADLMQNPKSTGWKLPKFERLLQQFLGTSYEAYHSTMRRLSESLRILSQELASYDSKDSDLWLKFKFILSRQNYDTAIKNIRIARGQFRILKKQALAREEAQKSRKRSPRALDEYRNTRRHALNIFEAFICGDSWNCACKREHILQLHVHSLDLVGHDKPRAQPVEICSLNVSIVMALSDAGSKLVPDQAIVIKSIEPRSKAEEQARHDHGVRFAADEIKKEDKGVASLAKMSLNSIPWPHAGETGDLITDLCSRIRGLQPDSDSDFLGFLQKQPKKNQLKLYSAAKSLPGTSLRPVSAILSDPDMFKKKAIPIHISPLSLGQRLYLAHVLACTVIRFHGGWLNPRWTLWDFHIPDQVNDRGRNFNKIVCLAQRIPSEPGLLRGRGTAKAAATSRIISSQILFPLGLALVDLALGYAVEGYQGSDATLQETQVSQLDAALARLEDIEMNALMDEDFCQVVRSCLRWENPRGDNLNDERLDQAIFERIVEPLRQTYLKFLS